MTPIYRRRRNGFTLMEMVITLAVFIMLASAVFGLMTGVFESTSTLLDNQTRRDDIAALNAYLKNQVGTLTANSTLVSYQRGDGEGLTQNGILYGTADVATAIDAKVQSNGYYTLRQATFTVTPDPTSPQDARQILMQSVTTDDPSLIWMKLVGDIKTLDWKFQDLNVTDWVEQWNAANNPNLVEFVMQGGGDLQPTTMDFWIPKLDKVDNSIAGANRGGSNNPPGGNPPGGNPPPAPGSPGNPNGPRPGGPQIERPNPFTR